MHFYNSNLETISLQATLSHHLLSRGWCSAEGTWAKQVVGLPLMLSALDLLRRIWLLSKCNESVRTICSQFDAKRVQGIPLISRDIFEKLD